MSTIDNVASNPGMTKESTRELTADELDAVSGGKLLEAAAKGKVFSKVEIHGTA
jgi:hypothetical protein